MVDWEDYYEILGVSPDSSDQEIKDTYRYKVNILHPDRLASVSESIRRRAEEDLKKVNRAYDILKDPEKRKEYRSEWIKHNAGNQRNLPKPRPVVDPTIIRFSDVKPLETKTSSFTIRNLGGPYSRIWISNPDSWVKVVSWESLTSSDELPMKVELEAQGDDWEKSFSEYIRVKLDEEETTVRVELETKTEPVKQATLTSRSSPYTTTSSSTSTRGVPIRGPGAQRGLPKWAKFTIGLVILIIIPLIVVPLMRSSLTETAARHLVVGKIAFVSIRDGNKEIYSMDSNGENQANLTNNRSDDWDPSWSPDANEIVFVSNRDGRPQIYLMNGDGTNVRRITNSQFDDVSPSWFPDKSKIIFTRQIITNNPYWSGYTMEVSRIFIVNTDGTEVNQFAPNLEGGGNFVLFSFYNPVVSPDGNKIIFTADTYLYSVDINGTNLSALSNWYVWNFSSWSPDSTRVVSSSKWGDELAVWNLKDGKGILFLKANKINKPTWSSDGSQIVFDLVNEKGKSDIYTINIDLTGQSEGVMRRITMDGSNSYPTWGVLTK